VASFVLVRTKTPTGGSFAADAAPNTTPPDAADVIDIPGAKSGRPASNTQVYIRFETAAGVRVPVGDLTATVWIQDVTSGSWVNTGKTLSGLAAETIQELGLVLDGPTFFQITARTNPATATQVKIFIKVV